MCNKTKAHIHVHRKEPFDNNQHIHDLVQDIESDNYLWIKPPGMNYTIIYRWVETVKPHELTIALWIEP